MKDVKELVKDLTITTYKGMVCNVNIEQKIEDIDLIMKYNDHGDEYIVVRTKDMPKDEAYCYGYFADLRDCPMMYEREPVTYLEEDEHCRLSNAVFRILSEEIAPSGMGKGMFWQPPTVKDPQFIFTYTLERYDRLVNEQLDIRFDFTKYKEDFLQFLDKYDILTEDNIEILTKSKWINRAGDADGIAGYIYDHDGFYYDELEWVWFDGDLTTDYAEDCEDRDEWGYDRFYIELSQFDSDPSEWNETRINNAKNEIDDILVHLNESLKGLNVEVEYTIKEA